MLDTLTTTESENMVAQPPAPDLFPFRIWAKRRGLPLSTAYVVAHRHGIPILKIGRRSFVSSDDDARFIAEVRQGRAAIVAKQDGNLRGPGPRTDSDTSRKRNGRPGKGDRSNSR